MPVKLTTRVIGTERLLRATARLSPKKNQAIARRLLRELAFQTQRLSQTKYIKRGGKGPPVRDRITSRTGTGRRSIGVDLAKLPRSSETGSALGYMAVHEVGGSVDVPAHRVGSHTRSVVFGRKVSPYRVDAFIRGAYSASFPKRPWLEPSVDEVVLGGPALAARIWESELDGV